MNLIQSETIILHTNVPPLKLKWIHGLCKGFCSLQKHWYWINKKSWALVEKEKCEENMTYVAICAKVYYYYICLCLGSQVYDEE